MTDLPDWRGCPAGRTRRRRGRARGAARARAGDALVDGAARPAQLAVPEVPSARSPAGGGDSPRERGRRRSRVNRFPSAARKSGRVGAVPAVTSGRRCPTPAPLRRGGHASASVAGRPTGAQGHRLPVRSSIRRTATLRRRLTCRAVSAASPASVPSGSPPQDRPASGAGTPPPRWQCGG